MKQSKNIILCVTSSISAYKTIDLSRNLMKLGHNIHIVLSKNTLEFITPLTFEVLTGNKVYVDMFDRSPEIKHISLAKEADIFVIVPATANIIGKIANGIADDFISTTVMATKAPVLIAPAMNTNMYSNKIMQDNILKLKEYGYEFINPQVGLLACNDIGEGKLADINDIESKIISMLTKKDMIGLNVLVTAGATMEHLDPVRFISNHSSGKMGTYIANNASDRGANVTLITVANLKVNTNVKKISVTNASQMYDEVMKNFKQNDIIIKAAAVSDYRADNVSEQKIKKSQDTLTINLIKNTDILKDLGKLKTRKQFLCGFSMETTDLINGSMKKLKEKNCDMIIANDISEDGVGFNVDTNKVSILYKNGQIITTEKLHKKDIANIILDKIIK